MTRPLNALISPAIRLVSREVISVDLDGTGPGLSAITSIQLARCASEGQALAKRLVGSAEGDFDVVPSCGEEGF